MKTSVKGLPHARPSHIPLSTILAGVVVLGFGGFLIWWSLNSSPLEKVESPERALPMVVSETMEFYDAQSRMAWWERLFWYGLENPEEEIAQAIDWYEELARTSSLATVELQLAILQAETGHWTQLYQQLAQWKRAGGPLPIYARLLWSVYETTGPLSTSERWLQARLVDGVPPGWFHDRLAIRVATRSGDELLRLASARALQTRTHRMLWWNQAWAVLQLLLTLVGCILLVVTVRRRRKLRVGDSPLPPPWSGAVGTIVLIRGVAMGIILAALALVINLVFGVGESLLMLALSPLLFVPLLVLARQRLLLPAGVGFRRAFGLSVRPTRWRQLGIAVLGGLAIGAAGEWIFGWIESAFGLSSHWAEWFDSELAWGSALTVGCNLVSSVIVGPMLEEFTFRGLLFGTCRRKWGWGLSALLSSTIFGALHGYDLIGFVSTFWSGLVWAWLYEATGSLLPGIIVHGLSNLFVSIGLLLLRLA